MRSHDLVVVCHLTRGRARAPSSSGTRASRRGPPGGRGRRSTRRRRGASARDRHVGSGRRRRRERARGRTRTRSRPSSDERRWRRTKPLRSSEWSDVVAASGSRPIELAQNTLPTTAASCSRLFSESGSPSRRAAMMPWSVSGSVSSSVEPCSDVELDELLGVERIAARPLEQRLLCFGREQRPGRAGARSALRSARRRAVRARASSR